MSRAHHFVLALSALMVGIAVEVLAVWYSPAWVDDPRALAALLRTAARMAQEKGLYTLECEAYGRMPFRLVVSDQPISAPRAKGLRFSSLRHACWTGLVAVSAPWPACADDHDPEDFVFWKGLFVCGDREVLRRLMDD